MLLEERPASAGVPHAPPAGAGRGRAWTPRRTGLTIVGASLVLAALSLLLPSTPTYDPWAWIIWGREITQLDLSTVEGPSWKPLPVLFTTVFALFGDAAPDLWLVVARAGAIASLPLAFLLARRLGGGIAGGVAAAAALAIAPWWIRNGALGNSEGLIVAFVLAAIDRHLAGDRRSAFLLAVGAGLLRPEAWPFLGLYGLWLLWRRHLSPALVVGSGGGVLALWLLPEYWGSGDLLRAANRAKEVNPGAPTYADNPALAVLEDAMEMLTAPVLVGLAVAVVLMLVRRDRVLAGLFALGLAWLGLVALMTSDGFSGNQRYLITPVALAIVLGGAGAGAVLSRVLRHRRALLVGAVVAAAGVLFAAPSFQRFEPTMHGLEYQARLTDALPGLIEEAGGAEALKACGTPFTGPFLVPLVAWNLGIHTSQVELEPVAPAVVFRERTTDSARGAVPTLRGLDGVPKRNLAVHPPLWRIVAACEAAA